MKNFTQPDPFIDWWTRNFCQTHRRVASARWKICFCQKEKNVVNEAETPFWLMNRLLLLKLFLTSTQRSHLAALDDAAGRYVWTAAGGPPHKPSPPAAAKLFRSLPAIWKFDSFNSFRNVSVSRYLMNFLCLCVCLVANCPRINEQVAPLPAVSSGSAVVISEMNGMINWI